MWNPSAAIPSAEQWSLEARCLDQVLIMIHHANLETTGPIIVSINKYWVHLGTVKKKMNRKCMSAKT